MTLRKEKEEKEEWMDKNFKCKKKEERLSSHPWSRKGMSVKKARGRWMNDGHPSRPFL